MLARSMRLQGPVQRMLRGTPVPIVQPCGARSSSTTTNRNSSSSSSRAMLVRAAASALERDITLLYDGDCPLCLKEVNFLKGRDEAQDPRRISFVDISAADYDPALYANISFESAMRKIHAILKDGSIVTEVEVFRRLYEAVGLGWVYAITKNATVLALANKVYGLWADKRTELTGREALDVILTRRNALNEGKMGSNCRDEDGVIACDLPVPPAKPTATK